MYYRLRIIVLLLNLNLPFIKVKIFHTKTIALLGHSFPTLVYGLMIELTFLRNNFGVCVVYFLNHLVK